MGWSGVVASNIVRLLGAGCGTLFDIISVMYLRLYNKKLEKLPAMIFQMGYPEEEACEQVSRVSNSLTIRRKETIPRVYVNERQFLW